MSLPFRIIAAPVPFHFFSIILFVMNRNMDLLFNCIFNQVHAISEAFENFQLKTYGTKAQVHETMEKKRRRL